MVRVLAVTVTMRLAPRATAPVPRFKEDVPVKVKSPFQEAGLFMAMVIAAPEVLSMVPPLIVNVPPTAPRAWVLLTSRVAPASKVTPPLKVLAPDKVKVPAESVIDPVVTPTIPLSTKVPEPAVVKLSPAPPIAPPSVKIPALVVTVYPLPFKVTAPVPRFKLLLPVKAKLPFQCSTLLLVEEAMALPEVLSMVPEVMVKVPVPKAATLLISKVPAVKVTPPVKVLAPARVRVPAETVTVPEVVPTTPLSTRVPPPALLMLSVFPPIAPPKVKVFAETVAV